MIYINPSGYKNEIQIGEERKTVEEIYYERVVGFYPSEHLSALKNFFQLYFDGNLFKNLSPEEVLKKVILMPAEELKIMKFNGNIEKFRKALKDIPENETKRKKVKPESKAIYELKKIYTEKDIMQRSAVNYKITQQLNTFLIDNLGLQICPYCNRNYIHNRGERFAAQMDHFYDKDHYPWFSVSLYNFIPSCSSCNHIKGATNFDIHPFIESENKNNQIKFSYILLSREDKIEVKLETTPVRENDINKINLKETYTVHSIDIQNMLDREERYSQSYRDELRKIFKVNGLGGSEFQLSLTDDEIDRMIYGDSVFEEDIRNIPLGKFRRDIYQEIKNLRKD